MEYRILFTVLGMITLLFASAHSVAAGQLELMLDQPRTFATFDSATDNFDIALQANRSICCTITATNSDLAHFINLTGGAPYSFNLRGKDSPPTSTDFIRPDKSKLSRLCFFTPEEATPTSTNLSFGVGFNGAGTGTGTNVAVSCVNTSLIGGYNTSVTDFNFLEITVSNNTTTDGLFDLDSSEVQVVLLIRDTVNKVSLRHSLTITTNAEDGVGREDVSIHDLVGNRSFGPIIINHDGPPGSVSARLVQYKITSTNPFQFQPVLEQQFTRLQSQ